MCLNSTVRGVTRASEVLENSSDPLLILKITKTFYLKKGCIGYFKLFYL